MDFMTVLKMILAVVSNKYVIITFVGVAAYIGFINYVLHYRRSSALRRAKAKKAVARAEQHEAAPAETPPSEES